jgi:hypothetical protein
VTDSCTTPSRPPRCSDVAANIPLAGTAPVTRRWWLIEHHGPWGIEAVATAEESWIAASAAVNPGDARVLLIRRHSRRARDGRTGLRRIFTFASGSDEVWGTTVDIHEDPGIGDFRFQPSGPGWQITVDHPRVVMCTNGRRDRCCAERARPLLDDLPPDVGAQVWECTHLGGHRFAPVALTVPRGIVLGRLTGDRLIQLVRHGRLDLRSVRGRSDVSEPEQVADIAGRRYWGEDSATVNLSVDRQLDESHSNTVMCVVTHPTGDRHSVRLSRSTIEDVPASCGKPAVAATSWHEAR